MRGLLLLSLALLLPLAPLSSAQGSTVHWSGEVVLEKPFVVAEGQTLVIEEGTVVKSAPLKREDPDRPKRVTSYGYVIVLGELRVHGSAERPVLWRTNLTLGSTASASLRGVHFDQASFDLGSSCSVATAGSLKVEHALFTNNTNALCLEGGRTEVRNSTFRYNGFIDAALDLPESCYEDSTYEEPTKRVDAPSRLESKEGRVGGDDSSEGQTMEQGSGQGPCTEPSDQGPPGASGRCWRPWQGNRLCRGWGGARSVSLEKGHLVLTDSLLEQNNDPIWVGHHASVLVRRTTFRDNDGAVVVDAWSRTSGPVVFEGNVFERHGRADAEAHSPWHAALQVGGRHSEDGQSDLPAGGDQGIRIANNTFRANGHAIGLGGDVRGARFLNNTVVGNAVGLANDYGYALVEGGRFNNSVYDLWLYGGPTHLELRNVTFDPAKVRIEDDRSVVVYDGGELRKAGLFAVGLGVVATLLAVLTDAGRWLLMKGALALGYTRLRKEELPRQATRERLLLRIAEEPGAHLRELAAAAGSYGSAVYHLTLLEREGLVRSARDGVLRRFYPAGKAPPASALAPLARQLLALAGQRPGLGTAEAARALGCSRQLAAYHAGVLVEAGFLTRDAEGRLAARSDVVEASPQAATP